jgi:hypothetical protein
MYKVPCCEDEIKLVKVIAPFIDMLEPDALLRIFHTHEEFTSQRII